MLYSSEERNGLGIGLLRDSAFTGTIRKNESTTNVIIRIMLYLLHLIMFIFLLPSLKNK